MTSARPWTVGSAGRWRSWSCWTPTGSSTPSPTRKLAARDIPADTRTACAARDLGARDPAGRTTIPLSDLHHLNGDRRHDPDEMAHVSPAGHHRVIHRHGWTGRIDPATGRLTWTHPRTGRTITTLPWTATLSEATDTDQ